MQEYEIWSDLTNMTSERSAHDIEQINCDVEAFFDSLNDSILNLSDEELEHKRAVMHQRTRAVSETRSLDTILERTLNGHIKDHLIQLRSIRETLAI